MEVNSYIIHITIHIHFRHRNVERISEFLTKAFNRPMFFFERFIIYTIYVECSNIDSPERQIY